MRWVRSPVPRLPLVHRHGMHRDRRIHDALITYTRSNCFHLPCCREETPPVGSSTSRVFRTIVREFTPARRPPRRPPPDTVTPSLRAYRTSVSTTVRPEQVPPTMRHTHKHGRQPTAPPSSTRHPPGPPPSTGRDSHHHPQQGGNQAVRQETRWWGAMGIRAVASTGAWGYIRTTTADVPPSGGSPRHSLPVGGPHTPKHHRGDVKPWGDQQTRAVAFVSVENAPSSCVTRSAHVRCMVPPRPRPMHRHVTVQCDTRPASTRGTCRCWVQ